MGSKRTLPWNNSSQAQGPLKRHRHLQSSQSSSQRSSATNSRTQPIIIDISDDELYEEIFSTPLQPELDEHVSIGYIGILYI